MHQWLQGSKDLQRQWWWPRSRMMQRTSRMKSICTRCIVTRRGEEAMMILNWTWKKLQLQQNKSPPNNWRIIVPRKNLSKLCLVKHWMIINYKRPKLLQKLRQKGSSAMKKRQSWTVMMKKLPLKLRGNDSRVKLLNFWRRLIEKKLWSGKPKKQKRRGLSRKNKKLKLSYKNKNLLSRQKDKKSTKKELRESKRNVSKQKKNA